MAAKKAQCQRCHRIFIIKNFSRKKKYYCPICHSTEISYVFDRDDWRESTES